MKRDFTKKDFTMYIKYDRDLVENELEYTDEFKTKEILKEVYSALEEKGYKPINQLVGYLISGDPTYITNYKGARALISKLERDEILEEVLKTYLKKWLFLSKFACWLTWIFVLMLKILRFLWNIWD